MSCFTCILAWLVLGIAAIFSVVKIYRSLMTNAGRCKSKRNIAGQVVIVTGANIETAKDLAMRGAKVIIACRNLDRGQQALDEIKKETGNQQIFLKLLELSSLASVRKFCTEIIAEESRLDVLVNNAGAATNAKTITEDGIETNFAGNHFGPFLLTNLLLDLMHKSPKSRIVNVSSDGHMLAGKELDLSMSNLNSEKGFEPVTVYARTKLANILFTKELARRLRLAGIGNITVNVLHPGCAKTSGLRHLKDTFWVGIVYSLGQIFFMTAEEGAQTSVHLAVSSEVDGISGEYFAGCKGTKTSKLAQDSELAKKLWDISVKTVNLRPEESIWSRKSN